jgi:flagellar hook-basal body complex protein FliE
MSMSISAIQKIAIPEAINAAPKAQETNAFRSALDGAVQQLGNSSAAAEQSVQHFLSGSAEDLHSTALAVQRAELELELALQVRNKVVQAYQEIMRMPV